MAFSDKAGNRPSNEVRAGEIEEHTSLTGQVQQPHSDYSTFNAVMVAVLIYKW